jgi:phosphatidylethanolamine-binding protein (PEBP) family uncharacterized protein
MIVKINDIELKSDIIYQSKFFKNKKIYTWSNDIDKSKFKFFTTIIIDPDAHTPETQECKYYLHLLVINSTETKVEYKPPSPPKKSNPHRYCVLLLGQVDRIEVSKNYERCGFNFDNFMRLYELIILDEFTFKAVNSSE